MTAGDTVTVSPLAVSMGEPAGIGGELALLAWREQARARRLPFFLIDWPARLESLAHALGWTMPIAEIERPAEAAAVFAEALPVLPLSQRVSATPGQASPATASAVIESLDRGIELAGTGAASGLVTLPIHKAVLYAGGFTAPGHTEYLATRCGAPQAVMMLCAEEIAPPLRTVPVTIHIPLADVPAALTGDRLARTVRLVDQALRRDFAIPAPRLALTGLNPHAGESGRMGRQEVDLLVPVVAELQAGGIDLVGPVSADSVFHARARAAYDAILCPYHDQALIPIKTLAFDTASNVTLGLPIVRTSPDHGTALSLAGTGRGDPASLIASLELAARLGINRSRVAPGP